MKVFKVSAIALAIVALCSAQYTSAETTKHAHNEVIKSGVNKEFNDANVRPQDDFFRHVSGKWLNTVEIPADKASIGAFSDLRDSTLPQLKSIIEGITKQKNSVGSDGQKIADLYLGFLDQSAIEKNGLKPILSDYAKIDAIKDKNELPALFAWLNKSGIAAPIDYVVHQDNKDSTKYVLDIAQSGLGLPDRDYYLKDDDVKLMDGRTKYLAHVIKMLAMSGDTDAEKHAKEILTLETELAKLQWSRVELRDPVKGYNKYKLDQLNNVLQGFDWSKYLSMLEVNGKVEYLIVGQPSYLNGLGKVIADTPLEIWKTYFKWHVLNNSASMLPKVFDDEHFAFYGTTLRGVPQQEERWKRAVRLVDSSLGESLGKLYVAKHFPPAYKAKMEKLVGNLMLAFEQSIDGLDWMTPTTKKEAQGKLSTFMLKIGYPEKWKSYAGLKIVKDDLIGNARRAKVFAAEFELNKLGKPIDRAEWGMTPQTVNAYYNPELNEIVFPAAILQPPFFFAKADDAVNYGAIGAVIGHEISHGFDDQGAQYDGQGNLRDWWSKEDHEKFAAKTATLVKQYNAFSPVKGYFVNGELTLGENIADNSGLAVAYKAYKLSLGGKPAPIIDGLTGDQRFYMGFGQVWRTKMREASLIVQIKTDPHSPGEFRANGTLRNQAGFYEAYKLKEGDKLYLTPQERVTIW